MKLREVQVLQKAHLTLKGFSHNSFCKKIRLTRKKSFKSLRNCQILDFLADPQNYSKMLENHYKVSFWKRKSSVSVAWLWFFVLCIPENLRYIVRTYLIRTKLVKKFLHGFKMNNLVEKFQNGRIFHPSYAFEILKKSLQSGFLEAQIISTCRMALIFCSMYFWEPTLHSQNLFDTNKTRQKIFAWL